jgi:pyrrolysine biosynthesis protein PylD
MTRLKAEDLKGIVDSLGRYDELLRRRTGRSLKEVACDAVGVEAADCCSLIEPFTVGVVPICSGEGVLGGFVESVGAVVEHIGFRAFVTEATDVAGTAEAVKHGADILMMADDHSFVALNIKKGLMVDNGDATAKGFVAALDLMCGGLGGREVLVLGYGNVGCSAAAAALERGAKVALYDKQPEKYRDLEAETGSSLVVVPSLREALNHYRLIVDATNEGAVIEEAYITPGTYIAAPGVPLGLTEGAVERIGERLVHDPLQIGAAVMAVEAAAMDL